MRYYYNTFTRLPEGHSQALGGGIGGKVSITHEGIVEVEEAITNPP